jgi:copper transport protein
MLPALALLLAHARHDRARGWRTLTAAATQRFSRLGIVCVGALLVSGVINSWNLLAGPRDLVATDYGRLVLLKIGLFVAMVGIAAVNKYHLTPQLTAPGALRALQRNSLVETGLGLCVLLFVGALGTMAPTVHAHTLSAEIPPDAAFVHIHDSEAMADVTIDPGHAGRTTATIHVTREDSSEFPAKVVALALDPPKPGGKTVERATKRMLDGSWQADDLDIPQPGIWTLRVTVTPKSGQPILLDAPIVIEP